MDISLLAVSDHGAHAVEPWITYLFTGLLGAMVVCLALEEKIHEEIGDRRRDGSDRTFAGRVYRHLAVRSGGSAQWTQDELAGVYPWHRVGVVTIILGSSLFVDVTSKSGLFTFIAIKLTKMSKGDPRRLLGFTA